MTSPYLYYRDDLVQIYLGDNRELLPELPKADLLLTDPPYGIGADRNLRANKQPGQAAAPSRDYGDERWDQAPTPEHLGLAISSAWQAIIWGGNYFQLAPAPGWLVWDKDNGGNGYADCELAWTNLPMAIRRFRYRWMGMLQEEMGRAKERRIHPTQKPVSLMRWCIELAARTEVGRPRLILDPWMGSGSTLRAAKDLGIPAIGIDHTERWCQAAAERMAQTSLELDPQQAEPAEPTPWRQLWAEVEL